MEIQLPEDEKVDVRILARIFEKMNQSYKLFWFKAIVEKVCNGIYAISYDELANDMIVNAWYMVLEYRLSLGAGNTKLVQVVKRAGEVSGLKSSEKREKILKFLRETGDKEIIAGKKELVKEVPYRILRPFTKQINDKLWEGEKKKLAQVINMQPHMMYYFKEMNSLYSKIEVQPIWIKYIQRNSAIILGWIYYRLIDYLQKRNPSIPGIPNKLYPPDERQNIITARKYWKAVVKEALVQETPIIDIYGKEPLKPEEIVIDHFIPWSYLTHDELWNLNVTIRNINSSKGNQLPDWKTYIESLCEQEYRAYQIGNSDERIKKLFEKCKKVHVNDERIREGLYRSGKTKIEFSNELTGILLPVYESAKKAGFHDGWIWSK